MNSEVKITKSEASDSYTDQLEVSYNGKYYISVQMYTRGVKMPLVVESS
jgi:hypothetical protein